MAKDCERTMSRGIRKVRKSIMQRKKRRGLPSGTGITAKHIISSMPQEEEKHGYVQTFPDLTELSSEKSQIVSNLLVKGILSITLFFGTAWVWKVDSEKLMPLRSWANYALTVEFPFAKVNVWYRETFGNPLAFSPDRLQKTDEIEPMALPVTGSVTESFQTNGKGIMIAPDSTSMVSALQEGIVIFAGNDRETNKTIKIQHPDGSISTYGYLNTVDVHLYQPIDNGQELGQFTPTSGKETFYFSIQKNKEYVDPIQVIQVDDQS